MSKRLPIPRLQAVGLDGRPLAGAKLYTYLTGTNTPKATWSDAALSILNANPLTADAAGRFGPIFVGPGDYRIVLEDSAGTVISTDDPVEGSSSVAGTTLTGPLTLAYANPFLVLNKAAAGQANTIEGDTNGVTRWRIIPGNATAETGANAGSDLDIEAHNDAGAFLSRPLRITRSTGAVTFNGSTTFNSLNFFEGAARFRADLRQQIAGAETTGQILLGNGTSRLYFDGTRFDLNAPLDVNGQAVLRGGSSAVTTLSTTVVDIGSIPSNARRVTIILDNVSLSGTAEILFQIGDAGGIETTGYSCTQANIVGGSVGSINRTTGWSFDNVAATDVHSGALTLHLADPTNHIWVGNGIGGPNNAANLSYTAGRKQLTPGPLTQIRVTTTNGTDTFDGGTITVAWEV